MIPFRPRHVRTRLTLWYTAVLAAVLLLYAGGTCGFLLLNLRNELARHAIEDVETVEGLFFFSPDGQLHFRENYHNHPESKRVQERYMEAFALDGTVLYRNERLDGQDLGGPIFANEGVGGYFRRSAKLRDGTRILLFSRRHTLEGRTVLVRLAYSQEPLWRQFDELLGALLLGLPLAVALAGIAGFGLAKRTLAPLERMATHTGALTAERLNERLPVENPDDELGHLATVINKTLARLEQAFEQMRRFTSDASHELRTPLAAIRSVGEVGLHRDGSREQYRDIIGSMLEEVNRLTSLIDNLLTISRADAGQMLLQRAPISLLELTRESSALLEVLMEDKKQQLQIEGDSRLFVEGDRILLRHALVNILHNAVKYSDVGCTISVRALPLDAGRVAVEIRDNGCGIPPEHQAKIFQRFYRVDRSRSNNGGAGLGLAIADWTVRAHGGKIELASQAGQGSTFRVELPVYDCAACRP